MAKYHWDCSPSAWVFPKISWIFLTSFFVQQVWKANQLPLDWSLFLSRNMTLGMVLIRGASPKWQRFVRPRILCVHVRSRLTDWHESQQDGHITEGHFEVIFCVPIPLNSWVVLRTANFEMELGRELLNITAGNFEQKKFIVI